VPVLVIDGATTPWMSRSADTVANAVPGAKRRTLEGQPHNVDPAGIAPALVEFFAAWSTAGGQPGVSLAAVPCRNSPSDSCTEACQPNAASSASSCAGLHARLTM
jgi:hypothetical protein